MRGWVGWWLDAFLSRRMALPRYSFVFLIETFKYAGAEIVRCLSCFVILNVVAARGERNRGSSFRRFISCHLLCFKSL